MASVCVNTSPIPSSEAFLTTPSNGWLSPRFSFSRDLTDAPDPANEDRPTGSSEKPDPEFLEFEFRLGDSVTMLPADELFSDGKLMPLHLAPPRPAEEPRSPEPLRSRRRTEFTVSDAHYAISDSPRAPRCSSRWRELLGLKRQQCPKPEAQKAGGDGGGAKSPAPKSLKHFLHRNPRSAPTESSLTLPLLRDSDSEPLSVSSRRSLSSSSSSSGADHDDIPRLSLDMEKPAAVSHGRHPPRMRYSRPASGATRAGRSPARRAAEAAPPRGVSVDSPRMNASGRVVFQGLERSSSSPGSFVGGPRPRPRGMERSYSANVRVTPVLNVPVCSLRGSVFGFGQLFSPQKKDRDVIPVTRSGDVAARLHAGKVQSDRSTPRD